MSSSPPVDRSAAPSFPSRSVGSLWRSLWPSTLTGRLVLTLITLVAVVSIIVATVTTFALRSFLFQRLDDQLQQAVGRSEDAFPGGPGPNACEGGQQGPTGQIPAQGPGALTGLLDASCAHAEVMTEHGDRTSVSSDGLALLASMRVDGAPHTVNLPRLGTYRVVVRQAGPDTYVTGLSTSDVDATVGRLIGWEAVVALIGVALAALAGRILVRRQLRPLREVAATAGEVTRTPLSTGAVGTTARVPEEYSRADNEVGQLGAALNLMLGHVERALDARNDSEQQVRQFLADASHELRTPLSTIAGYAELTRGSHHSSDAGDGANAAEQLVALRHAMNRVDVESGRMTALVDDLLLLARLDAGRPLENALVDVSRLAIEALNDARVVAPDHQWRLTLPRTPAQVTGDEHRLHQVIANLLSNARRHTPPGTVVSLTVAREPSHGGFVTVSIHDDGPGLPGSFQDHAFERFTRGDGSRTRDTGGSGLGLPIVKAIVEAHTGSVDVHSRPGDTTFTVRLPIKPAHDSPNPERAKR